MNSEDRTRPRWLLYVELVLLVWAAVLLYLGLNHLHHNPILPWSTPTAVAVLVAPRAEPPRTAADSSPLTPTWPSRTLVHTWTPTHTPTTTPTLDPSVTPSATPTPSQTPSPIVIPSARPLESPTLATVTVTPDTTPVTVIPTMVPTAEVPESVINIMLLGSDARSELSGWRTDVIIIVSINPQGPSVSLLSIPRDLYVWVPEWRMSKINTVDAHGAAVNYPGGGPGLLKQTLLYNLGIPVHYYARVDFDGFQQIVNTLGGLDVPVTCEMTDWRLKSIELDPNVEENWELFTVDQRVQHMDGEYALWYVRSRKKSSDFDRHRRQQQVLRAMLAKGLTLDIIPQIPQLWGDFADTVETDMGLGEILQLAAMAPQLDFSQIKSRFLSGDALLVWTTPDTNAYVLLPQFEEVQLLLEDVFQPPAQNRAFQDPPVVEIWNGSLRPDLEILAADNLAWEGLVPVIGQADRQDYTQTQVIFYGQTFKGADTWSITKLFGVYEAQMVHQPNPDSPIDYRVILGFDYEPCVHKVWGARYAPTVTPTPVWTPPPG